MPPQSIEMLGGEGKNKRDPVNARSSEYTEGVGVEKG